jgi:hypothetical protein
LAERLGTRCTILTVRVCAPFSQGAWPINKQ